MFEVSPTPYQNNSPALGVNLRYREALATGIPNATPTELNVGVLLALNHDTKQIAIHLRMDVRSIDNHRYHIRKKLGLKRGDNLQNQLLRLISRVNHVGNE